MYNRDKFSVSKYFIVGPENTLDRDVTQMIKDVVESGFSFIQIRSKVATAREMIKLCIEASDVIKKLNKQDEVTLVVNDRLDVILAAREKGAKVDGIHVGQTDIPVEVCRKYLGEDSVIGLSADTHELLDYVKNTDVSDIDYFGAGPLRPSISKPDCGVDDNGEIITRSYDELTKLAEISKIPVVVGGGVKLDDLESLSNTGVEGFFVISAISHAKNPKEEAIKLAREWDRCKEI